MALSDFQDLFADLVRDTDQAIADAQRDRAIDAAQERYSQDRPRRMVEDLVSAGGHNLALPAAWEAGLSRIHAIEFPIGSVPPSELSPAGYRLYQTPSGWTIQLDAARSSGDTLRVSFTTSHTLDGGTDTIPERDREAVAALAASIALAQLAAGAAADGSPTLNADVVDHASKADRYRRLSGALRRRYFDHLGLKEGRPAPALAVADLDLTNSQGGDLLVHRGRQR